MAAYNKKPKTFNTHGKGVRLFQVGIGKKSKDYYYDEKAKLKVKNEGTSRGSNIQFDEYIYPSQMNQKGNERLVHLVTGISGGGKSRYTANFLLPQYMDYDPDGVIFLICPKKQDLAFDSKTELNIQRIEINDHNFVNDGSRLLPEDFVKVCDDNGRELPDAKSAMVVFDDIEGISNRKHKEGVFTLMNAILNNGRSKNIHCVGIVHNLMHRDFQTLRNECHWMTIFPHSLNHKMMEDFLLKGMGYYKNTRNIIYSIKADHLSVHPRTKVWLTPLSAHKIDNKIFDK